MDYNYIETSRHHQREIDDGERERDNSRRYHRRCIYDDNSTQVVVDLPFDVICNVLSRLPVKSLARFRAVSKPWNSLVQTPYFNDLRSKNNPQAFIFSRKISPQDSDIANFCIVEKQKDEWITTEVPLSQLRHLGLSVVATCNGLLCMVNEIETSLPWIFIYNPVTSYVITVRKRDSLFGNEHMYLCFDTKTDKYKLISMHSDYAYGMGKLDGYIRTLGDTPWRRVEFPKELGADARFDILASHQPAFFKGELYWIIRRGVTEKVLIAMDISDETTRIINLTNDPPINALFPPYFLVAFSNHVSVILPRNVWDKRMHIWDLVDDKQGIWSHREIFENDLLQLTNRASIKIIGTTADDDLLLLGSHKLELGSTSGSSPMEGRHVFTAALPGSEQHGFPSNNEYLYIYNLKNGNITRQTVKDAAIPIGQSVFPFVPSMVSPDINTISLKYKGKRAKRLGESSQSD